MFGSTPFGATAFAGSAPAQNETTATPNLSIAALDASDAVSSMLRVAVSVSAALLDGNDQAAGQVFISFIAPVVVALDAQDAPDVMAAVAAVGSPVLVNFVVTDQADTVLSTVAIPQSVRLQLSVVDVPDVVNATTTSTRPVFGAIPRCRPAHRHSHRRPPNIQSRC